MKTTKRPPKDPYATTYHRDKTVTIWDVYSQHWVRTARPSDRILATCSEPERQRIIRHCERET